MSDTGCLTEFELIGRVPNSSISLGASMTNSKKYDFSGKFDSNGRLISTLPVPAQEEEQHRTTPVQQHAVETARSGGLQAGDSVAPEIPGDASVRRGAPLSVTNAEFVAEIFGRLPDKVSAVVCTKFGDPTVGGWSAMKAGQIDRQCLATWNNYGNCSSFYEESAGTIHARKDSFHALHFILMDDMGTKAQWEQLGDFKPSFVIETSPGNYQAGIILAEPLIDIEVATRLLNAVIAKGLSDPGATGVARWARLPVGSNGKAKYKSELGESFQCRLVRWNPERRYTVEEIVAGLSLAMSDASLHHVAPGNAEPVPMASREKKVNPADVALIPGLLDAISSDCSRTEWMEVLMAVHHTTGGSDAGLEMVDAWSRKCKERYKGSKDVEVQWRSLDSYEGRCFTISRLKNMAREAGADVPAIEQAANVSFDVTDVEAFDSDDSESSDALRKRTPLDRYSLKDSLVELERQRVEQRLIFGEIVLLGQATVLYALANTGKTLILLHLIIEAIKKGRIDPSKLYYINMDDNSSGLVTKVRLAVEYGFHMLADGHRGFAAKDFRAAMEKMIESNTASGAIVAIDTLKKFVNTMNKEQSADFTRVVRQFSLKGGTVIALSHANKNPEKDGKIKYTGTTDIVDDFDCAYTLQSIGGQTVANQKVVEFTNIKRRGDVAETAAYSYSTERGLSYNELLTSVQTVDADAVAPIKHAAELVSDAAVIAAIAGCIASGIHTKMRMVDAAAKSADVSNRAVLKTIEKYTGEDTNLHRWKYVVRERGAQVFELLDKSAQTKPEPVSAAIDVAPSETIDAVAASESDVGLSQAHDSDMLEAAIDNQGSTDGNSSSWMDRYNEF